MKLIDKLAGHKAEQRNGYDFWLDELSYLSYANNGVSYTIPVQTTYGAQPAESVGTGFAPYVQSGYARNGVVFACVLARMLVFSEARFLFRTWRGGLPGDLFGSQDLQILEKPWPNGTTGELLSRMEQDVSFAGNFFAVREQGAFVNEDRLFRLRPDWVRIVLDSAGYDANIVGYAYYDQGNMSATPDLFPVETVCHWSPIPDPLATYRGMAWLTPVVREVESHNAATSFKGRFFGNAATPNMIVKTPIQVGKDEFERFTEKFRDNQEGTRNAYKTLILGSGADATVVGSSFQEMDFKATQGMAETVICAASGVPAVIVGVSEGLDASTYSNYSQARRKFGDHWARPQWRSVCSALSSVVNIPTANGPAELWYDDRDIPFLREDKKDDGQIKFFEAQAMRQLADGGWDPDSVVQAILSGDWAKLNHTGKLSVQLQAPGTVSMNGAKRALLEELVHAD